MIHLHTSGSAYEIGVQHGAACPEAICLAYKAWGQIKGVETSRIEAGMRFVEGRLQRLFPEMLEEMQGIAAGSGLSYRQIFTLTFRHAIIGNATDAASCSNIGFADSDVGVLLGKTADWNGVGAGQFTLWQRYQPATGQGYTYIHYGGAGTVWTEGGLNEAGLGVVSNGLPGAGLRVDSVPASILSREVLQHCRDVQDALDFLGQYEVMYWGINVTLADAGGDLAFIEIVPGAQAVYRPQGDFLIHTNHCVCPETLERQLDAEALTSHISPGLAENSRSRYRTLARIVPQAPRTLAQMQALLRDRSVPGAISQKGEQGMHTVYAMTIAPVQGKLWGAEGYPPDVSFVEYEI